MKNFYFGILAAFFILTSPGPLHAKSKHLTVLFFNDLHGYIDASENGGGAARIATIVQEIEEENKNMGHETITLFGGDAITGSLISYEYNGAAEFEFFNALGLDAMVIGNHEFDNEISGLQKLMALAKFPVLAANIYWKDSGKRFAKPYTTLSKDGLVVGILGLITSDADVTTHPKFVGQLRFTDPIKEAKKDIAEIKEKSFPVVALTHIGPGAGKKLAAAVPDINLVIGGHEHGAMGDKACILVKKTPYCMTPANGKFVGRVDLKVEGKKVKYEDSKLIAVSGDTKEDQKVAAIIAGYSAPLEKKYSRVIGFAKKDMKSERGKQCALGRLVAESIRWKTKADVGLMNSGGLRAPIKKGPITLKNIYELAPFVNTLVLLKASGQDIVDIVNFGTVNGRGNAQFSGIRFDMEDNQVKNIQISGKPLNLQKQYLLGTHDFLTSGGDGYSILKKLPVIRVYDGTLIRDAVVEYIKHRKMGVE